MPESTGIPVPPGSYCTRCRGKIEPEDVAEFLRADHLCIECAGTKDAAHAQRTITSERGPTVRDGNGRDTEG